VLSLDYGTDLNYSNRRGMQSIMLVRTNIGG